MSFWDIVGKICKGVRTTIENQNHYNPPEVQKKRQTSDATPRTKINDMMPFGLPVKGKHKIWSGFRSIRRPYHNGVDIASPDWGCYAPEAGVISTVLLPDYDNPAQFMKRGGKWIRLWPRAGDRAWNPYAKLTAWNGVVHYFIHINPAVEVKTQVVQGEYIGTWRGPNKPKNNGSWGNSRGQHIHWGVKEHDKWIDPMKYYKRRLKK